jgi:hypothetical protein
MYTLFNKRMQRCLVHPKYGLWCTEDIESARKMLEACQQCCISYGLQKEDFALINVDTKEEVL